MITPVPKPSPRTKSKRLPKGKSLKRECLDLWTACIYIRAGFKSELSGKSAHLNEKGDRVIGCAMHHIAHKPNYRLMFELDNGICLTSGEHSFGVHGENAEEYRAKIIAKIGQTKWDWLHSLKHDNTKTNLALVKIYLRQQLWEWIKFQKERNSSELLNVYLKQIGWNEVKRA